MNSTKRRLLLASLTAALLPLAALAQQVEVFYIDRSQEVYQNGANSVIPIGQQWPGSGNDNFGFGAGAMVTSGSISNFRIANSVYPAGVEIPWDTDDESYDLWVGFATKNEMMAAAPAGTYTFTGTGSSVGSFSHSIVLNAYSPQTIKKIVNYDALQSFDPTKDVVVQWEPFSDAGIEMAFIEVEVRYWNGYGDVLLWSSSDDPRNDGFGLPPNVTSVTIPAGTLVGSPYNHYSFNVYFLRVDKTATASKFPGAIFAGVTSLELETEMHAKQDTPGRLVLPVGQWMQTGKYSWVFGLSPDWGYSFALGYFNVTNTPDWIYQSNLGWLYCSGDLEAGMWFYHPVRGWLFTTSNYGGFYVNLAGTWANMINP